MARVARIALDLTLEASKTLKPAIGTAWQYAKTEIVPPMTINFFHGPVGKKIEEAVSKAGDSFVAHLHYQIKQIDLEEARAIKRKEAEAKAAEAKIKAEAKKKEEAKLAKEAKAQQQAAAEKKAKVEQKAAAEAVKAQKTTPVAKKDAPQKNSKRQTPKKTRRENKKGSSPKSKKR